MIHSHQLAVYILYITFQFILFCFVLLGVPEGVYQMFRSHHLAVLVFYITFQFVYAAVVSITLFVVIVIAVNG